MRRYIVTIITTITVVGGGWMGSHVGLDRLCFVVSCIQGKTGFSHEVCIRDGSVLQTDMRFACSHQHH
jgi:hypothetical protein